jgi:hypothetical protein
MFYDLFADLPFEGAKAVNWIHEDFDERSTCAYYPNFNSSYMPTYMA